MVGGGRGGRGRYVEDGDETRGKARTGGDGGQGWMVEEKEPGTVSGYTKEGDEEGKNKNIRWVALGVVDLLLCWALFPLRAIHPLILFYFIFGIYVVFDKV